MRLLTLNEFQSYQDGYMKDPLEKVTAYLRAPLAPEHLFVSGLLLLMTLRWLMVFFLVLDLPPLEGHVPPWYFHTGGDQESYYNLALALAHGQTGDAQVSLGTALVMVPFIWLLNPTRYRDIVAPLVIINGFILGGASVPLIGLIGKDYSGDKRVGILSAAAWLLLPGVVYLGVGLHPAATLLRGSLLPKLMWLTGISDGPANFSILLAVWGLGRALEQRSLWAFFVAGVGLGWAVTMRIQVVPVVAWLLVILLLMRAWRGLRWVAVGGLLGYLPQAVYNTVEFGIPFYTAYLRTRGPGEGPALPLSQLVKKLPYSPDALLASLTYFTGRYPWLVPVELLAGAVGVMLLVIIWRRRGWPYAAILLGVPVVHIAANVAVFFFPDDPVRHSMLAYPYLLAIGAYLVFLVWDARRMGFAGWRRVARLPSTNPRAGDT